ncbi:MAG: TIGR02266 family protein [Labilithrix sp.]|nr:TIGR02266 family protein [Labilithrix sp.]MCW5833414.1 TIGR02266 family protein [Labilithrix sp.]
MAEAKDAKPGAAADDRRDQDRAAITLKVDYKRLNTFFADYTKNISKGGTFIRTTKPLEVGTEFVFVLTVPEPTPESAPVRLELTGRVKWVVPESDATEETPAGMGIQFVFAGDAEQKRVETVVAELMRSSLGEHLAEKLLASR